MVDSSVGRNIAWLRDRLIEAFAGRRWSRGAAHDRPATMWRPLSLRDVRRLMWWGGYGTRRQSRPPNLELLTAIAVAVRPALLAREVTPLSWSEGEHAAMLRALDAVIAAVGSREDVAWMVDYATSRAAAVAAVAQATAWLAQGRRLSELPPPTAQDIIDAILRHRAEVATEPRPEADRTEHITGSDVVRPSQGRCAESSSHGGDGNSGEVQAAAQTAAEGRKGGGSQQDQQDASTTPQQPAGNGAAGTDSREGGQPERSAGAGSNPERRPAGLGGQRGDEPRAGMGTRPSDEAPTPGDATASGSSPAQARRGTRGRTEHKPRSARWDAGTPAGAPSPSGEVPHALSRIESDGRALAAARRMVAALRRIIRTEVGTAGERSPRIDGRALVRELVSRRVRLTDARRHEADRLVVVLADHSDSCYHVVADFLQTTAALVRQLRAERIRVAVVWHSNGCAPAFPSTRSARLEMPPSIARLIQDQVRGRLPIRDFWRRLAALRPGLILALGDHDADWALEYLASLGSNVVAVHHHAVAQWHRGVRRIGPASGPVATAMALAAFERRRP